MTILAVLVAFVVGMVVGVALRDAMYCLTILAYDEFCVPFLYRSLLERRSLSLMSCGVNVGGVGSLTTHSASMISCDRVLVS